MLSNFLKIIQLRYFFQSIQGENCLYNKILVFFCLPIASFSVTLVSHKHVSSIFKKSPYALLLSAYICFRFLHIY